jgi:hypothetical protein
MDRGASTPIRTESGAMRQTVMTISAPIRIDSPYFLVRTSIVQHAKKFSRRGLFATPKKLK